MLRQPPQLEVQAAKILDKSAGLSLQDISCAGCIALRYIFSHQDFETVILLVRCRNICETSMLIWHVHTYLQMLTMTVDTIFLGEGLILRLSTVMQPFSQAMDSIFRAPRDPSMFPLVISQVRDPAMLQGLLVR